MDALRTSVSVLAHFDPDVNAPPTDHAANVRKAERMLAQMPTAVATGERISRRASRCPPRDDLDFSANFLYMVNGKVPSETDAQGVRPLAGALHRARAERLDVLGPGDGLDALGHLLGRRRGDRHAQGPAPRRGERGGVEGPRAGRLARAGRGVDQGRPGPQGADHGLRPPRLQDRRPPRRIFKEYCAALAAEVGDDRWERIAEPIEQAVTEAEDCPPNVDWPSARLYHYMGLDIDLYTPIFAMARVAGWAAHIIEQLDHNRLMRPRARYIGPPTRAVVPIDRRQ